MPSGVNKGHENDPPGIVLSVDIAVQVLRGKRVPARRRQQAATRLQAWLDGMRKWGRESKRRKKAQTSET